MFYNLTFGVPFLSSRSLTLHYLDVDLSRSPTIKCNVLCFEISHVILSPKYSGFGLVLSPLPPLSHLSQRFSHDMPTAEGFGTQKKCLPVFFFFAVGASECFTFRHLREFTPEHPIIVSRTILESCATHDLETANVCADLNGTISRHRIEPRRLCSRKYGILHDRP